MQQQINFYRSEYRTTHQKFSSGMLLATCGAIVMAMFVGYGFSMYKALGIERELKIVTDQEKAAIARLENFQPGMDAGGGDQSWEQRLEEARRSLRDQQLVLGMVADSSLGDTQGFSHHLTSLARQDTEGLWLSYTVWGGVRSLLLRPLSRPALLPRAKIPGSRPSRSENRGPLVNSQQETCMKIHTQ